MSSECDEKSDRVRVVLSLSLLGDLSVDELDDLFRRSSEPWERARLRRVLRGLLADRLVVRRVGQVYELTFSGSGLAASLMESRGIKQRLGG